MFSLASKTFFALAVACGLGSFLMAANTSDRVAFLLLAGAALVSAFLGLTALASTGPGDRAALLVGVQTPLSGRAPQASPMPLVAALGLGTVGLGAALGAWAYVPGLAVLAAATLGWFTNAWVEHPNYIARLRARVGERLITPTFLPVGVLIVTAFITIAVSRIFLAASKTGATFLVIAIGTLALLGGILAASQRRVSRSVAEVLVVVGALAVLAVGVVGLVAGERTFHKHAETHGAEAHATEAGK